MSTANTAETQRDGLAPSRFFEVAEGVYAFIQDDGTWWINNAGLVLGDAAGILIDTCTTAQRTKDLLSSAVGVSAGLPLRYALNTHHHGDHTFGNSLLPTDTSLIGHTLMREGLVAERSLEDFPPFWTPKPELSDLSKRLPDVTIHSQGAVHLGSRAVELHHPGYVAHTAGDLAAWVPDVRVLFVGDLLFPGHTPMLLAGSPAGAIRALDWIAGFDAEVIVPGHGEVVERSAIDGVLADHRRYYDFVLTAAHRGLRNDLTPVEVARSTDLGEFGSLLDSERFILNVHSAYAEADGQRADRATAFTDLITWTGSPVHTRV
ncbi:MBL fold metallo-hydrolase [Microbacterium terregens]|uniref:MBL fold metallo-hydrolase n=1 Tax=Microbacterium terregens TaxID=69363 RepID=A0ABV5SYZ4_9MICO